MVFKGYSYFYSLLKSDQLPNTLGMTSGTLLTSENPCASLPSVWDGVGHTKPHCLLGDRCHSQNTSYSYGGPYVLTLLAWWKLRIMSSGSLRMYQHNAKAVGNNTHSQISFLNKVVCLMGFMWLLQEHWLLS